MIDILVDAGFPVSRSCRMLGVSYQGYYAYRRRPLSPTKMRREWLTALIREIHADSRGTYGSRRVHAELTKARGIHASLNLVTLLMHNAGVAGLPGPAKVKRIKGTPTSDDLVERKFARSDLDELWVTDITEHRTREGKVYCCAVMDTCSRRIIGWSIDSVQDAHLVVNALDMALQQRRAKRGRSCTPTTACSSPLGPSPMPSAVPGSCRRSGVRRIRCRQLFGGGAGNRTRVKGFAEPFLARQNPLSTAQT